MKIKVIMGIVLTVLLVGMLTLAFDIQPLKAGGTIYIKADGSVNPPTAPISSLDNITYIFTDNIYDEIVVERDNIVVDGAGYTLQGTKAPWTRGISLSGQSNITIKNIRIEAFYYGIYLNDSLNNAISGNTITGYSSNRNGIHLLYSSNNSIYGNSITKNAHGICLWGSSNNSVYGNSITANRWNGTYLGHSSNNNNIYANNITNNPVGIGLGWSSNNNNIYANNITKSISIGLYLYDSSNNTLYENKITECEWGIWFWPPLGAAISSGVPLNNKFYHNDFNNTQQVDPHVYVSYWDDGYPSGGNYWSDYNGTDLLSGPYQNESGSDGIGDTPYIIDANNIDRYPLMKSYGVQHDIGIASVTTSKAVIGRGYNLHINMSIVNYGNNTESFNVTAYANSTTITTPINITLTSRNFTIISLTWNTTGVPYGNYTISANITLVPGETETTDNTFNVWVLVSVVGDVNGDCTVDGGDQISVGWNLWWLLPYPEYYNPNADVNGDGNCDGSDQITVGNHLWESWP